MHLSRYSVLHFIYKTGKLERFPDEVANVIIGDRQNPYYSGLVCPDKYGELVTENTVYKKNANTDIEGVTIFLPRNEPVLDVEISFDDAYTVEEPTPYRDVKPIVYYGSSITEARGSAALKACLTFQERIRD